mgnify:CR=1 FL=1
MPKQSIPVVSTVLDFVRSSFRRKLTAVLVVVSLLIGVGVVGLYVQVGGLLESNVEQSMTAAAESEAGELSEWSGRNRLVARLLSEHPVYDGRNRSEIREYLRSEDRRNAEIVRAYVVNRRNQTVTTSTDTGVEGTDVANLSWAERFSFRDFDDVQTTEPHAVENRTVVAYISPIRRIPGCLLVVEIDTAGVFERFEHPVDNGFTRVVDSNGTVVFSDDPDAALTQYYRGTRRAPVVSSGLRGESGFTESPVYDRDTATDGAYIAAYAAVPNTDWVVVEHAPADEAYVISRQVRQWIGWIAVLVLLAFGGAVGVLGRDVTTALSRITDRAERIEDGQYDVEFDTDRADEFGDLNRTLAATRDTLQQRIAEVRDTKAELADSNEALEERSEMVAVLNRVLRHNVRNEVNVITGRARLAASRVDDETVQADLAAVQDAAWELSTISKRTQRIKHLLADEQGEPTPLQLDEMLATELAKLEDGLSCVRVDFDDPDGEVVATASRMFPVAVADVVDQIATRADGIVHVTVSVTTTETDAGETAVVRIEDDGDGLPAVDVAAVSAGEETPLNHAEGLALWSLEWTLSKVNGELCVSPEGATFEARVPVAAST